MFEHIFLKAKEVKCNNEEQFRISKVRTDEKKASEEAIRNLKVVSGYVNVDYKVDNCSNELLSLISRYGFEIKSYEKNLEEKESYYDELLETYFCEYKNWQFSIKNYSDVDIPEGIFAIGDIKHSKTREKVDYYCDLGCRNTSNDRLDKLLRFFEYDSEKEFCNEEYKEYINLPKYLKGKGLNIEVKYDNFTLKSPGLAILVKFDEVYGSLKNNKDVIIRVTNSLNCDVNIAISTHDELKNDFTMYSSDLRYGEFGYNFKYNSKDDIDELIKCTKAYHDHINGKIGFYENEKFYTNRVVEKFFKNLKNNKEAYEKWNYYLVKVKELESNLRIKRKYGKRMVNKYEGIEIASDFELTFNDASQWSEGDKINNSFISVTYNKNIDKDNCILYIENYVYKDSDEYLVFEYHDEYGYEYNRDINQEFLVGAVEYRGSFTDVMTRLKQYVYSMCDIHGVPY